ncbi:major facilitator family transporter [Pseudomonas sp. M47T1]|uniref:MFS transporter n=1 Tax=Pseudomonas sp. M47T1 TaxID=1179778 RepID=UPI00026082A0|nr:MFS transporter [Pseudomonas sp. M47T1]EIK97476.1 major facilitator family transporter [Pseudomonas sp. M47T1]
MSTQIKPHAASTHQSTESLPIAPLLALAMTGFLCIVTETLPAGLLPGIVQDLKVSPSQAGQMVTAYAAGSLIAAIPLSIATQRWRRRSVLLATIIGFLLFNSITAISPSFIVTLIARFLAGAAAGLGWSLIGGYARRLVKPELQGRALAIAMAGTPLALSLGVPLGTWLGNNLGWRATFGTLSGLSVALIVWSLLKVPNYPGHSSGKRMGVLDALSKPGVKPIMGVILAWMLAHNILYTYIAPFVSASDLSGRVDKILFGFGASALIGIWAISRVVDNHLRVAVLVCLIGFLAVSIMLGLARSTPSIIYAAVVLWGLTFGGAATLLQTALAKAAGPAADVAQSISVVVWNTAIAGGGVLGGIILHSLGVAAFPWVLLVLISMALCAAYFSSTHAFPKAHNNTVASQQNTPVDRCPDQAG